MTGRCGGQQPVAAPGLRQRGFTLFELVVVILVVSIIVAYAFNRFRSYPAAAERANFLAVTAQIKAGVNLQMMHAIASGHRHALQELEGSNPMDLMLEAPGNYAGEFSTEEAAGLPRRTWYFDRSAGELVYLVDNRTEVYEHRDGRPVPTDRIRMRLRAIYGNRSPGPQSIYQRSVADTMSEEERGNWHGLQLQAVHAYTWEGITLGMQEPGRTGPG